MARQRTNVERNTFIRGLVTEAGPLTFPENASKDELNFVLNRDGSRQRRLGMDYEDGYSLVDTLYTTPSVDSSPISSYRWDNVGNDSSLSIGVIQIADRLFFMDMASSSPSSALLNGGAGLKINSLVPLPLQFAAVNGVLVVVGAGMDTPIYLEYDPVEDSVLQTAITIEVRDIWGVWDYESVTTEIAVDERPAELTQRHEYNLRNQGWTNDKIAEFFTSQSVYPSLADVWHLGKDSNDDFDPTLMVKQEFGTTRAARGRFIIDAFNRGLERNVATGLTELPLDSENGNISTTAAFAGRIFYSGVQGTVTDGDKDSPQFSGTLFFSRILDSNNRLGECFQAGDPTSEFQGDVLANDGGTLQIPEAAGIIKLMPKEDSLLVFAENGVWLVSGIDGSFVANNYFVRKVTNVGAEGPESIVDADGTVLYWAKGGIYQLTPDPRSGRLVAQNLTERTIQKKYGELNSVSRQYAKGVFDSPTRQVKWLYNDTDDYTGLSRINQYNKELVLDFVLGAFFIQDIKETSDGPYVSGHIQTTDFVLGSREEKIVVGVDQVVVGTEDVIIDRLVRSRGNSSVKYITLLPSASVPGKETDAWTLSGYTDGTFVDWKTYDGVGVDAGAYMLTGEELFGDTARDKQVNYLTVHLKRTETGFELDDNDELQPVNPGSCSVSSRWDFADHPNSGKYSAPFEAYRLTRYYMASGVGDTYDYGQEVITSKTKLRGSGKAVSLRFETSPGKDLYLYGWALSAAGNTVV
jgi:hypothetical protein